MNAVQMLHSHGATGDLLSTVEILQWQSALEPFSVARVVQSSDHVSQNLGQFPFKHVELEERRKYSDFLYLGCGLNEAVSLLAEIKHICQCLADVYAERLEKQGWDGIVPMLGLSLLDAK